MARVDLNAKRAARSEAENEPHEVVLGFDDAGAERVFRLKPQMPLEFTELLNEGQTAAAVKLLLVDPAEWEAFRAAVPDQTDLLAIAELYAVDLPEAGGSPASSRSTGGALSRTSNGSIASTSPGRATGRKRSGSAASAP